MKKIAQLISTGFSLFWNGKISLPWMYWFWGVVVGKLIFWGTIFLTSKFQLEPFGFTFNIILLPYYVFWMVGTWRSASNYKGLQFWANLTKLLIIGKIVGLILLFFFAYSDSEQNQLSDSEQNQLSECIKGDCNNGYGTYTWNTGDKYVGEHRDGKPNGQGTYTWANGNKYVGEYKDGKYHGQGTYTATDGTVIKGIRENGKLVELN